MLQTLWEAFNHCAYKDKWMQTATFPGRYDSLVKISKFFVEAAKKAGLSETAIYQVELAVDEACTNIIEHAYKGESKGNIHCEWEITDRELKIMLVDHGKPFNPKKVPDPKPGAKLSDLKGRGAGLFLIRKMMDEVNFEFLGKDGNRLTMIKRKD
jgi:serine/threonine-protein kinase RsbW